MNPKLEPSFKTYYNGLYYRIKLNGSLSIDEVEKLWDMFKSKRDHKLKAPYQKNIICYLHNEEQLKHFINVVDNKKIDSIQGPLNKYHKSMILDPGYEIKKTLYYNKYRYRVDYGLTERDTNKVESFLAMLRAMVKNDKENFLGQSIYQSVNGWSWPRLYVAGDEQLMIVKLSSEEQIRAITKVVTIKEIKQHG